MVRSRFILKSLFEETSIWFVSWKQKEWLYSRLLLSGLLSSLLSRLLRGFLLLLLLHSLHWSNLLHDLLLLNQECTQNAIQSLAPDTLTDHEHIYGTDFRHKHELQNAEVRTVFSYHDQRYEESILINKPNNIHQQEASCNNRISRDSRFSYCIEQQV